MCLLCYVAHILLSQITVQMQISLFGFTTIFGSMLFAVLFLCTDILNEHYGKEEAYRAVLIGAGVLIFFLFVIQTAMLFQPTQTNTVYGAFSTLFSNQWRIVLADLFVSYLIFQLFNIALYDRISKWTKRKFLWMRVNVSTIITQILIAVIFFQIAFFGSLPQSIIWQIIIVGLVMKILITLLETPFMYLSYKFLPKEKVRS